MVIGILAAISIVAYNGISNNANDAAVQSDFSNFAKKYELIRTEAGQYPNITAAMGITFTKSAYMTNRNNLYICVNPVRDRYALSALSKSGKFFMYDSAAGKVTNVSVTGSDRNCEFAGTTSSAASFVNSAHAWNETTSVGTWSTWVN